VSKTSRLHMQRVSRGPSSRLHDFNVTVTKSASWRMPLTTACNWASSDYRRRRWINDAMSSRRRRPSGRSTRAIAARVLEFIAAYRLRRSDAPAGVQW